MSSLSKTHADLLSPTPQLPSGWCWTKLGEVADFIMGQAPPGDQTNFEKVGTVFVKAGEFGSLRPITREWTTKPLKLAKSGDVLICVVGATSGKLNLAIDCAIGRSVASIRPRGETFDRFIHFQLMPKVLGLRTGSTGSAQGVISKDVLAKIEFVLPPLDEQHRIVAEIEKQFTRLDAGVASLKRVQAALKRYRASVLKAACEGQLVPTEAELARCGGRSYETASELLVRILRERRAQWELAQLRKFQAADKLPEKDDWKAKYTEGEVPDAKALPILPAGWTWVRLGQLTWSVKDGPHYSPQYVTSGIPFISGGNIRPSGVDFQNAKRISVQLHSDLSKRCKPEFGDLLYTKGGTTGIARVNTYHEDFSVWVHVAVLKMVLSIEPFYVQHALNSPFCYAQAQRFTHGVGNQDLGLTRMVRIALALPPLAEQQRIVAEIDRRLSVVDEIDATIAANLKRGERLRQSILQRAFTGQLLQQTRTDQAISLGSEQVVPATTLQLHETDETIMPKRVNTKTSGKRRALLDVLREAGPLSSRDLFGKAGFTQDSVDAFYEELRELVNQGKVREERPRPDTVLLKAEA